MAIETLRGSISTDVARAVLLATQLREESWKPNSSVYGLSLEEACTQATAEIDPNLGRLIYLALEAWWNDTLEWANDVLKESE